MGAAVHHDHAVERPSGRRPTRRYLAQYGLWLAACLVAAGSHAHGAGTPTQSRSQEQAAERLSIQLNNDRMTLAITKVPQVYLYGVIDADAPQRFEAMVEQGKIPAGSDIYLNASDGDLRAGMALGRLFRKDAMVTHLGTPRRSRHAVKVSKTATCVGACSYAYFGGLYRWAPTGSDRIGLPSYHAMVAQTSEEVAAYLKDMGIDLRPLTATLATSRDPVLWLTTDLLISTGLANNARLPLTVQSSLSPPAPSVTLDQVDRNGRHRLVIQCRPGRLTITSFDMVGAAAAREILRRGTRAYIEINRQETLLQPPGGARAIDDSLTMTHDYPPTQIGHLLLARTIGAWVDGKNKSFRNGFVFELDPVREDLKKYYSACWKAAPWPTD
jgi:Predicted periplasmic protein